MLTKLYFLQSHQSPYARGPDSATSKDSASDMSNKEGSHPPNGGGKEKRKYAKYNGGAG